MPQRRSSPAGRAATLGLLVVLVAAWWLTLAPRAIGGPVSLVLTRGTSMLPDIEPGDLVVLYRDRHVEVGDVVGARHPSGELVVHRVVSVGDVLTTQGDNVLRPDPWTTAPEDVAGTARLVLPGAARVVAFLARPLVLGVLAALTVLLVVLLETGDDDEPQPSRRDRRTRGSALVASVITLMGIAAVPGPTEIPMTADDLTVDHDTGPFDTTLTPGPPTDPGPGGGGNGGGGGGSGGRGGGGGGRP